LCDALKQCAIDADKLDEASLRTKYEGYSLLVRSPSRKEMDFLRARAVAGDRAAPSAPAALTWDEQRALFKRRIELALKHVEVTFGRFVAVEGVLYDGHLILLAGKRDPKLVGRTQAELEEAIEAAWVAGGCKPLVLEDYLRYTTVDGKNRQEWRGRISAETFARCFGRAGFDALVRNGAHSLDLGQRNVIAGGVLVSAGDVLSTLNGPCVHSLSLSLSRRAICS
jgi:hypothetical protein